VSPYGGELAFLSVATRVLCDTKYRTILLGYRRFRGERIDRKVYLIVKLVNIKAALILLLYLHKQIHNTMQNVPKESKKAFYLKKLYTVSNKTKAQMLNYASTMDNGGAMPLSYLTAKQFLHYLAILRKHNVRGENGCLYGKFYYNHRANRFYFYSHCLGLAHSKNF
jgi:hypothetical protein